MKKTLQKKKKGGRPALPTADLRETEVRFRVTLAQKAELFQAANRDGLSLANWIRSRLGLEAAEYRG